MSRMWARRAVRVVLLTLLAVPLTGPDVAPALAETGTADEGPSVQTMWHTATGRSLLVRSGVRWNLDAGVGWPAEEQGAEVASYDVRLARTPMTATRQAEWHYPDRLQGWAVSGPERGRGNQEVRKRLRLKAARGQVLCLSSRATDTLGNVGHWSTTQCVTRLADDRRLLRLAGAHPARGDRYWRGSATVLDPGGALLMRRVPAGSRVDVLYATKGGGGPRAVVAGVDGRVELCELNVYSKVGRHHRLSGCSREVPARRNGAAHGPLWILGRQYDPVAIEGIAITPAWAD